MEEQPISLLWAWMGWEVYGNTIQRWLIALLIYTLTVLVLKLIKRIFINRAEKLQLKLDLDATQLALNLIRSTQFFLFAALGLYFASLALDFSPRLNRFIQVMPILAFLWQASFWGNVVIDYFLIRYVKSRKDENEQLVSRTMMGPIKFIMLMGLWAILSLLALDNIGVNITALVAGLGVGGIAIALAVQNILGDLFAALTIVIDKPFVVGDFIIVGDMLGSVEHIGLKTTRVRSLGGEQLIFSNSDLLQSRIRNYKRMEQRRVVFSFRVLYQTTPEQLRWIPSIVRSTIEAQQNTRFDRAHFFKYGDSSLDFEVVYNVLSADYNVYMDIQQEINLQLYEQFAAKGVEFAYPTRTLYVANEKVPLSVETLVEAAPEEDVSADT